MQKETTEELSKIADFYHLRFYCCSDFLGFSFTGGSWGFTCPLSINTAIGRRAGIFSHVICITTVMGTDRNMPTTPQIHPQKIREKRIRRGLMLRRRPWRRGSRKFPMVTWVAIIAIATAAIFPIFG